MRDACDRSGALAASVPSTDAIARAHIEAGSEKGRRWRFLIVLRIILTRTSTERLETADEHRGTDDWRRGRRRRLGQDYAGRRRRHGAQGQDAQSHSAGTDEDSAE